MISSRTMQKNDLNHGALDLTVKKRPVDNYSSSSSTISNKRMIDSAHSVPSNRIKATYNNKRPLRFQCKFCDYKAPSTSLMQNHIYRHTDSTPYACAYCGHKSTTKSTIMVHIELCHPNMEVNIIENRVREQDFYRDVNASEIDNSLPIEPPTKKPCLINNRDDSESTTPINGVAIPLKSLTDDDDDDRSPLTDEIFERENFEPKFNSLSDDAEHSITTNLSDSSSKLKLKISSSLTPLMEAASPEPKESDSEDSSDYRLVYNRPKQFYGSLYEPDKQYACRLCSYTTNHRPSMEDHVFVHTNEKPYKCAYCNEELYTRYAATYHMKYKHSGMTRNFIQNKADVTKYYINRAKKDEEKNQFKIVDTRRVKIPGRKSKTTATTTAAATVEKSVSTLETPLVSATPSPLQIPTVPDCRFLLAWSYYLASQSALLSPSSNNADAAAKFLQAMQNAFNPNEKN